jgi:CARDB protein
MPTKMSLHFVLVAAVAMVGCAGAGETPVQPDNEAAAVAQAEEAGKATGPDAATEIAAPESTKIHTPISSEELSRLTSEPNGGKSESNIIVTCPACHVFEPDLTVVQDERSQTLCTPQSGCYPAFANGFVIKNNGNWGAPAFHVAVLMGSDSYGFDVPGLGVGQSIYFQITKPSIYGPACGETAVVLVNPFNAIVESSYNNNAVSIAGYCFL